MDWIKKNPAQTALVAIALSLLASTYFLWANVNDFSKTLREPPAPQPKIAVLKTDDTKFIQGAITSSGGKWEFNESKEGSLFLADNYVKENGALKKPSGGYFQKPMSNDWLIKYGLSFLDKDVGNQDPDRDGFSTRVEWDGLDGRSHLSDKNPGEPVMGADGKPLPDDSTSPVDPNSHPPYYTRLRLAPLPTGSIPGIVSIPFRLKFVVVDINPRNPKDTTVQINTIDRGGRTRYVTIGDPIPETPFIAEKVDKKVTKDENGIENDQSVLTIFNSKTNARIPLPIGKVVNSPESYVVLRYLWVKPGDTPTPDMNKRKDETFKLPPELGITYKVVDIKAPDPQNNQPGEVTIDLINDKDQKVINKLILKTNDPLSTILN